MEGAGAVEELEVEGGGGLAVEFPAGAGLHGHCGWLMEGGMVLVVWGCVCHRFIVVCSGVRHGVGEWV